MPRMPLQRAGREGTDVRLWKADVRREGIEGEREEVVRFARRSVADCSPGALARSGESAKRGAGQPELQLMVSSHTATTTPRSDR